MSWYTMHRGAFFAVIAFLGTLVLFTFAASPFLDLSPVANAQGQNSDIDYEIGVVVYPGDGKVKLTWKPSGNQNWDDAQKFGYQYKLVGSGQSSNWSPGELNKGDETLIPSYNTDSSTGYRSYSVTNLTNGQLYSFVIRKKTGGNSTGPEYGPPSYPDQTTPGQPAAIKDLKVATGACQVTLAWTPPEQNGGTLEAYEYAIAEGYQGHYSQWREIPLGDITTDTTDANAPESSYIVTGLHAYAVYRFSVREVNEHGKAETSTGIAHRVSVDPCGTYLTYNLLADPADSQATLSWTVIPDPAETITKFQYRQKRGTGEWDPWHDIPYNNPSGPNSKTYTVTGLTNCKTYSFQVRAIYDIGSANDSNNASAKPTAESAVTFDSGVVPLTVLENTPAGGDIGGPITATGGSCPPISYSLSGVNAGSFDIVAESGQLQTQAALDYETKSSYTVTVTASDGTLTAAVDVTVTVTNIDEAGTVTLSTNQPPARAEITAALTDPDEGVTGAVWQWERSSDGNTGWAGIGTSSPSYTPVDGGVGYHLRARASYTDGHGPGKTAQAASTLAVQAGANRPPKFDSATATREVPENTEAGGNIGAPVTANDPDTGNTLTYTLEGADLDSFDIDSASGQIQTKPGVTYDHESKSSYSVTVKADDNNGGTATIDVTITVADVNEPPKFDSATATREVPENTEAGGNIGAPVTANDPDSDTLTYTLGGRGLRFVRH